MIYTVVAATGQLSWTVAGAPANIPLQEGFPISTLEWDFVAAGSYFRVLIRDRVTANTLVTFSNDPDADDKNNTCNGQTAIASILAEIKSAFNVAGGGGGGGGDATAANQVTGNGISNQILLEVGEGPEHVLASDRETTSGAVSAGMYSVIFIFSSDFVGTVNTIDYSPIHIKGITFTASDKRTLPTIPYTIISGYIDINTLV